MTALGVSHRAGAAWWLALFAVGAVFLGSRAGAGASSAALEPFPEWAVGESGAASDGGPARGPAAPIAPPERIVIPAIGVNAPVGPVGLRRDGAMQTPSAADAGWYRLGPQPGARGSAVIVGHVDTRDAPAVFAELPELPAGAVVGVRDTQGVWTIFRVAGLTRHPKEALPAGLWAPTSNRLLRLITCGGTFDARTGHYRDNVIAHAEALGRWRPPADAPDREPPWDRMPAAS